ncbi:MAG: folate-binding protein [Pseudoxanthomonas sp.]
MHKILVLRPVADNLSHTAAAGFALPDHAVVALEGPDAAGFAHAQFANDVTGLAIGKWQWNAWLTPKGRVVALFALLRPAEDRILLLLPDHAAAALAGELQRFVFRRKLRIEVRDDLRVSGAFASPAAARGAELAEIEGALELDFGAAGGARRLRIGGGASPQDAEAVARWFAFDLAHGLPRLPESQRGQWTPQQLSLERLPAFSVKKGCYPGQEIVARTHFLGQAKRGLALLQADAPLAAGAEVAAAGKPVGTIVSASPIAPWLALAVLPLERDAAALAGGGVAVREIALAEGLRR